MLATEPQDELLPSHQHKYADLAFLSSRELYRRREGVFLILAGLFLGTLAMLNIIGITRFLDLSFDIPGTNREVPMVVAVGVLPYPVTFLCTDFISELYGRSRANLVVWTGFIVNAWVAFILWAGGVLPGYPSPVFDELRQLVFAAMAASMGAYTVAQFVDVRLFHFWKEVTGGRHLWLRNNGSTLVSQLVDTVAVISITHFWAGALPMDENRGVITQLFTYILSGYSFKVLVGVLDTGPFYWGTRWFSRYLRLAPVGGTSE